MIKIDVFVQNKTWKRYISNPKTYLKRKIKYADYPIGLIRKKNTNFSILLAGNKEIKLLNKKFRKKNKITDILSFPYYSYNELKKANSRKKIYLGDIIVNVHKINKKNFKIEFDKLWIHGLLHLVGYKHRFNKDFDKMNFMEKKIFKIVNTNK